MLVHQVSLLHCFVECDFLFRRDDWLAADRACVVVFGPAEQALDVEHVVDIALEWHDYVVVSKFNEANRALVAERGGRGVFLVLLISTALSLQHLELGLACLGELAVQLEQGFTHAHWVDTEVN